METEIEEILKRYADSPQELAALFERCKKLHIKDGLPSTFVGVSVSMMSMIQTLRACEKLKKEVESKPGEAWDVQRSAWGCLIDRLTDLAMDDKHNIGMNIVQWGAFVFLALFFEYKGDLTAMHEAATALVKDTIGTEVVKKAVRDLNLTEGNASPTIN